MRSVQIWIGAAVWLMASTAHADDFEAGSYIIPMDTDYQDVGMLRAYGLVFELLRNGVPVRWVIREGKMAGQADFMATAIDVATATDIGSHGYRGGPWVIDAADAGDAEPIIAAWQMAYPETTVHEATEAFSGDVARYLVVAPTIAMVADGNEDIAREYMLAAAIPDSVLDPTWPDDSPDMLDVPELAGPTDTDHADGSLFDEDGDPVYCQLMSMHWGVADAEANPEVVAEVRSFLNNPTHFFAECQAVNAFENLAPHGFFLTPNGFLFEDQPDAVDFHHHDSPFGQIDGAFQTVGGSEPAYALPPGDMYKAGDIVMITAAGAAEGEQDVWMTGFLDGQCPPDQHECGRYGKVSYLGGHQYATDTPISANPDTQGARMFLNSLFEAPCATVSGLPTLAVAVDAPEQTTEPDVTFKITYVNTSFATALDAVLTDALPEGATFVSASGGGVFADGSVTWDLGNLGPGESGDVEIEVHLEAFGVYPNAAELGYRVGLNAANLDSNTSQTEYADMFPSAESSSGESGSMSGSGGTTDGGSETGSATTTSVGSSSGDGTGDGAAGGEGAPGCGCTQGRGRGPSTILWTLALLGLLRRRRVAMVSVLCACADAAPETGSGESGIDSATSGIPTTSVGEEDTGEKLDFGAPPDMAPVQMGCRAIDFLFVIDSSESMKDHQANLIASFPGFAAAIEQAVPTEDWHVLVVDTDGQWGGADCANACATLGSCPDEPAFDCSTPPPSLCDITIGSGEVAPFGEGASNETCLDGDERFVAAGADDLPDVFACTARVGVDGNSEERQAEAMVRAVSPEMLADDGCNVGFLRDDAILVVTIITDEPDAISPGEPPEWAEAILAAKSDDPEAVVILGLLPDGDAAMQVCDDPVEAPRLVELLGQFPISSRASVCEPDYSPFFAEAVEVIAETCVEFVPPEG